MIDPLKERYGNGLLTPLRRLAGRDFLSGSGEPLIVSALQQILKTNRGELPWRPSFGGGMSRFRHRPQTDEMLAEAEAQLAAAITQFEPRVQILELNAQSVGEELDINFTWLIAEPGTPSGVRIGPVLTEVRV